VLAAVPIAHGAGLHVTWVRGAVAVPAAVALAVLAALVPAWSASRAHPLDALRPAAGHFSSRRAVRSRAGLAVRNLVRARGRSLIAVAGLAVGICSTVLLLAITTSFNGQLAGDLLGEAVTVRVRGVDYAAIAVMLAIGVFGITDVLYLNIRERAKELATLAATGWSRTDVARLITLEGSGLGLIGSLVGTVVGVLAMNSFTNEPLRTALVLSAGAVVTGTALGALAALLAVQSLPRGLSRALAEE
jgi:ABC-type antimicrobial peptide transport system permease subunit